MPVEDRANRSNAGGGGVYDIREEGEYGTNRRVFSEVDDDTSVSAVPKVYEREALGPISGSAHGPAQC